MQRAYWTAFDKVLSASGGPIRGGRTAQPTSWMSYSIGRSSISLNAAMVRPKKQVRAELYLSGGKAKSFYHLLAEQKPEIERELGFPLDWEELPKGKDSRISVSLENADPENESDWRRQHEWLAKNLNAMHRVFAPRVRALDPDSR
ncbi:DUF4268 domain-containing protein, partial [Rhodoplanes sp. SY1]|uniref:DUF4268 domain-containing protein n=1 Tax=Rhodoplanes sp. SY1 TaxID=3166646 RepID=UPI0038B4FC21